MARKRFLDLSATTIVVLLLLHVDVFAGERSRSGSYQGRRTGGTWQQQIHRTRGHSDRSATWQNERGQGSRMTERKWNREAGTGSYASTTNRANGRHTSREGTVTRTGEGAYAVEGTRTTAKGTVIDVDKTLVRNPDGSRSLHSVYTGPEGQSRTVDSALQKTGTGRSLSGTYSTSGGKSGSFASDVTRTESGVVKDQSRTNQDGQTWGRSMDRSREGSTVTRDVTVTDPHGGTRNYTGKLEVETSDGNP